MECLPEIKVVNAIIHAYYVERDMEKVLEYVTDDIVWIGTEKYDSSYGKKQLRKQLIKDKEDFPEPFKVEILDFKIKRVGESVSIITVRAKQIPEYNRICGFSIRGTAYCEKQEDESWLISNIHVSVPNTELEKYSLSKELDETRKRQQMLLSSIPGGIAIYRLKKDGRVTTDYVSDSLAKVCNYTAEEFLLYIKDNAMINIVPEETEKVLETAKKCIEKKEPISVIYHIYTKEKNKILISLDAHVIEDETLAEDEIAVLYAVHSMVSQDAEKLIIEQNRYRNILDNLDISYCEWNKDGNSYVSEKYAEYVLSDFFWLDIIDNINLNKCVYEEDIAIMKKLSYAIKCRQEKSDITLRLKMRDKTYRWTQISVFFEYDSYGNIERAFGTLKDVNTEWEIQNRRLHEVLEQAQQANKAKTEFLSKVSHEMRTPLNGILGITSILQNNASDSKMLKDLKSIEQSGRYLSNLINDMLDVSRIENEVLELHPKVCDGRSVFNNMLDLIHLSVNKKDVKLNIKSDNIPGVKLYIDEGRLQQTIMNILNNAVKFSHKGGIVNFTFKNIKIDNYAITEEIIIEDNGIGMSKEFISHMFEPFNQEDNTRTTNTSGTGLGMTITKSVIDLMGGNITVESEVGKGTRFSILLPLPIATRKQLEEWESKEEKEYIGGYILEGKRILLCEDHPLNSAIAIRILESKGLFVEHAENGQVGVQMFENSEKGYYDAILMDIRMPVLDGIGATNRIRGLNREDSKNIPIIAMTANTLQENDNDMNQALMDAYLSKPIDTKILFQTLEDCINNKDNYTIKPTVMVVDDIEMNRAIIRESIIRDYNVIEVENGKQALDILSKEKVMDAVITDIQMPQMDGIELIRRIRQEEKYNHIAIIASTQYGEPEQEERLLEIGADEFVYKPSSPRIIKLRLHNVLKEMHF